jgi:hypothetical protein
VYATLLRGADSKGGKGGGVDGSVFVDEVAAAALLYVAAAAAGRSCSAATAKMVDALCRATTTRVAASAASSAAVATATATAQAAAAASVATLAAGMYTSAASSGGLQSAPSLMRAGQPILLALSGATFGGAVPTSVHVSGLVGVDAVLGPVLIPAPCPSTASSRTPRASASTFTAVSTGIAKGRASGVEDGDLTPTALSRKTGPLQALLLALVPLDPFNVDAYGAATLTFMTSTGMALSAMHVTLLPDEANCGVTRYCTPRDAVTGAELLLTAAGTNHPWGAGRTSSSGSATSNGVSLGGGGGGGVSITLTPVIGDAASASAQAMRLPIVLQPHDSSQGEHNAHPPVPFGRQVSKCKAL